MLRIDFWNIFWTVVNLVVLYLLLRKFLFGPILNVMEKRKELIDNDFARASAAEKDALELKKQYETSINNAKSESMEILKQAESDGQAEYRRIIEEANAEADQLLAEAQTAIDEEKKKAMRELETDIAALAVDAAEQILKEKSNPTYDRLIYDTFLSETGDSHEARGN